MDPDPIGLVTALSTRASWRPPRKGNPSTITTSKLQGKQALVLAVGGEKLVPIRRVTQFVYYKRAFISALKLVHKFRLFERSCFYTPQMRLPHSWVSVTE